MSNQALAIARTVFEFRKGRAKFLPREILTGPAWDILLSLYIANGDEASSVTFRLLADSAGTSPAVVERWVRHLVDVGLVDVTRDHGPGQQLSLTEAGNVALNHIMLLADREIAFIA